MQYLEQILYKYFLLPACYIWSKFYIYFCRRAIFGVNSIAIHVTPIITLLFKEVGKLAILEIFFSISGNGCWNDHKL